MAARIPMMAMAMSTSIRVKPLGFVVCLILELWVSVVVFVQGRALNALDYAPLLLSMMASGYTYCLEKVQNHCLFYLPACNVKKVPAKRGLFSTL